MSSEFQIFVFREMTNFSHPVCLYARHMVEILSGMANSVSFRS